MKQTAVEWLLENLNSEPYSEEEFKYNSDCWDKAQEMFKQQIVDAYITSHISMMSAEQYYYETFKQQEDETDSI
jgi:hypothetical protein